MSIFNALPIILQNGTLADAAQVMADFNKIINDGNANAAENGANSSITSLSGLTSPIPTAGGSSSHFNGTTSTGTAAAQVVSTVVPNNFALTTGNMVSFNPGFSSTGATTLNIAGTGALAVRKPTNAGPVALQPNDWVTGQNVTVVYDGTAYLFLGEPNDPFFGALTNLASAATTDLGTVQSQNVNITGTTTITSFGSSASLANPYYMITFAGALTLTNSASLVLPGGANITTAAGDTALMVFAGGSTWRVGLYQKRDGTPIVSPSGTSGVLVGIQVFTASGTYTPNASATKAFALVTGGGGGGGGVAVGNGGGGGGGAGGTTLAYIPSPTTLSVTIGGGGGGGAPSSNGTAGTGSSLGTITANGGGGGAGATGASNNGGSGGAATGTGTQGFAGGDGGRGFLGVNVAFTASSAMWGQGGASFWGGGPSGNGVTATALGAGGAGGSGATGGTGAAGFVVVLEFK